VAGNDRLNLGRDVEMLASVVLAEQTPLPLARGLFGDWGSGKSFFMAMLHERVEALAELKKQDRPEAEPFCSNIKQIHFNAWHYVDGNLWASLAATIFDGLVDEKQDEDVKRVRESALGAATKAAVLARESTRTAEQELRTTQERAGRLTTTVQAAVPVAMAAVREASDLESRLRQDQPSEAAPEDRPVEQFIAAVDAVGTVGLKLTLLRGLAREELTARRKRATIISSVFVVLAVVAVFWLASGSGGGTCSPCWPGRSRSWRRHCRGPCGSYGWLDWLASDASGQCSKRGRNWLPLSGWRRWPTTRLPPARPSSSG
jgi:hypothetical protein